MKFKFFNSVILLLLALNGCEKDETLNVPEVETGIVNNISELGATFSAKILHSGSTPIEHWGVCWSKSPNPMPTISNFIPGNSTSIELDSFIVANFTPNTQYYYRAYARNSVGVSYGATKTLISAPTISTSTDFIYKTNSIIVKGVYVDNGEVDKVLSCGFCWREGGYPTINDNNIEFSTLSNNYSFEITDAVSNKVYFVRAFVKKNNSVKYANAIAFANLPDSLVLDVDGNIYHTVKVGSKIWLRENFRATRFNDGSSIANISDNTKWINNTGPAYCWYNNDSLSYCSPYGALYSIVVADSSHYISTQDSIINYHKKFCPKGWHVASDNDWQDLWHNNITGGDLKETGELHWMSPNSGASNSTNFTALPAGTRNGEDGTFIDLGYKALWCRSFDGELLTPDFISERGFYIILNSSDTLFRGQINTKNGFSIRLVKD